MKPDGSRRQIIGTVSNPVTFRRNLVGFLVIFGLVNVMLIVLYPQVYSGEFLTQLNPASINDKSNNTRPSKLQQIEYRGRMLSEKNEHRSDIAIDPKDRLDTVSDSKSSVTIKQFLETVHPNGSVKPSLSKTAGNIKPLLSSTRSTVKTSQNSIQDTRINPTTQTPSQQRISTQTKSTLMLEGNSGSSVSKQTFKSLNTTDYLVEQALKKMKTTRQADTNLSTSMSLNTTDNLIEETLKRIKTTRQADANQSTSMTNATDSKVTTLDKLLRRISPTKRNTSHLNLNPTTNVFQTVSTTSFKESLVEEPSCKPYVLSAKALEYTTKKYTIHPEITECKDQKAPPHQLCKINETKSNDSYTNLEIKCDFSVCNRAKTMFLEYMDYHDGLVKKYVIPASFNNNEIEKLVLKFAEDVRQHDLPFLFVNCTDIDGSVVAQILTFLPSLPPREDTTHQNKININVFLVDSVSRPHFFRSFPKTVSCLREIKNDSRYPADVFNFELFQAVHGHTNENERALFNGSLYPVHVGGKKRNSAPVNLDRLYEVFKKAGFQTMFLDDLCWRGHWGIMDKYKTRNWKSLQDKLGASSIDSRGISESSCTILRRNQMSVPFFANPKHQICFNGRHQHEYVLDYVTKYIDAIGDFPVSKPLFLYTSTHVSHDDVGIRVQTLDVHLKEFIRKMSTRENTLSIIFADHGNTYTYYQTMEDGKREMYHPFMLMVVPKEMGRRFGGEVLRNLHENQRRLLHLFDLRAGLVELSGYDGLSPLKPTGIFGKIAKNRSCDQLLITEESKCICEGWEKSVANSTDQLFFAEYAIGEINNIIQTSLLESRAKGVPYNNSRVVFGSCQRLRVQNIANVKTRKTEDGTTTATTMDVRVQSSNLVDQVETITVQTLSKENSPEGIYDIKLLSHNRISTYGPYRVCMDKDVDVKLCVCNNLKDPRPQRTIEDVVGKHSKITNIKQCLYGIRRTYNDGQNKALVEVFEVANVCTNEEFTVTFEAISKNFLFTTKLPITMKLASQTARFIASARTIGNVENSKLNITWRVEQSKSA